MLSTSIRFGFFSLVFCCLSGAGYTQVLKQAKIGANVFDAVIIDPETRLEVMFKDKGPSNYVVEPRIVVEQKTLLSPATIRITGNPVEAMIDIEVEEISGSNKDNGSAVTISNFNLMEKNAGSSVTIMPYSDENSFLLVVGGTVSGAGNSGDEYTGLNILNINYL